MLITKFIKVRWHHTNREWYISKGYTFTKMYDMFEIKVEDLQDNSNFKIEIKCDNCDKVSNITWENYKRYIKADGKIYCIACANKLFGKVERRKTKLKNSISFQDWCYKNLLKEEADNIILRWDYELNKCSPKDVSYSSNGFDGKGYYFKCNNNCHPSEKKYISNFVTMIDKYKKSSVLDCNMCNSFAQWGIDNIDSNFIEKYWDYEKNIGVDPWKIAKQWNNNIWIKCQEKDYHGSYETNCTDFVNGNRCPYCSHHKIHLLDSLGILYPKSIILWSDKNKQSPYEYAPQSNKIVWWKCPDGKHKDYFRSISNSYRFDFRCPSCEFSKGEKRIEDWMLLNQIQYIPQKVFDGLLGIGNGNLSYDFYLPTYGLLIEYQGEQHEHPVDFNGNGIEKSIYNFNRQKEHDKRKKQYAIANNIKLLEIWYWDFDNIESILNKEIKGDN